MRYFLLYELVDREWWRFGELSKMVDHRLLSELVLVGIHQRFGDLSEEDLSEDGGAAVY